MKPHFKLLLDGAMLRCSEKPRFRLLPDGTRSLISAQWDRACGRRLHAERRRLTGLEYTRRLQEAAQLRSRGEKSPLAGRSCRLCPTKAAAKAGMTPQRWRDLEAATGVAPTNAELRALDRMGIDVGFLLGLGVRLTFPTMESPS